MKVEINKTYDVTDCMDCPFRYKHTGQGECWTECNHDKHGQGLHGNIMWGCFEKFKKAPEWCPLGLGK